MAMGAGDLRIRNRGSEVRLRSGETAVVGSDPSADLRVSHPGISRRHGEVREGKGGWVYIDTDSSNGSYIDGSPIERIAVNGPTTVLLGHAVDGEVLDLLPAADVQPGVSAASPTDLKRIAVALWVIAGAAVAAVVVAIVALVAG